MNFNPLIKLLLFVPQGEDLSYMEPPCDRGTNVCSNGPGHMTKMAAMPVYLLLRNQKADDLESWYAASGARVLPSLFK